MTIHESLKLIEHIRTGVSYKVFIENIERYPDINLNEWSWFLGLPTKKLSRNRYGNKKLSSMETERVIEIQLLIEYGISVFEGSKNFFIWLDSKNNALGGLIPKELFDTTIGINMVRDELGRIEHGIGA